MSQFDKRLLTSTNRKNCKNGSCGLVFAQPTAYRCAHATGPPSLSWCCRFGRRLRPCSSRNCRRSTNSLSSSTIPSRLVFEELQHGHAVSVSFGQCIGEQTVMGHPTAGGTQDLHALADDTKFLSCTVTVATRRFSNQVINCASGVHRCIRWRGQGEWHCRLS